MIQVGGTITAACAPKEQGSSICCSIKHVTLLWYCRQTEKERKVTYIYILYNTKTHQSIQPERLTACLHQEQLMATISLLWKANFCWNPCRWRSDSLRYMSFPKHMSHKHFYHDSFYPPFHTVCIFPLVFYDGPSGVALLQAVIKTRHKITNSCLIHRLWQSVLKM